MFHSINGLLVLDKPSGITSRDAVDQAMKWFPPRTRIGHTGTLDPLATGVLVLCMGRTTRLAEFVQEMDKTYRSTFVLGARSDTDDADGTITPHPATRPVERATIAAALAGFIGAIDQTPPNYSAVKIAGRRAHALARQGRPVEIASRKVDIDRIDINDYAWPELHLEIACGKGTYIRALARDLGEALGTGAYVSQLRRTRIGVFRVDDAVGLSAPAEEARGRLRPAAEAVAPLPRVVLPDTDIRLLCHGRSIAGRWPMEHEAERRCGIFSARGELIGVGMLEANGMLKPLKIVKGDDSV